ncbi:MAG: ATP-binding protein [Bacteroidota bacterium]
MFIKSASYTCLFIIFFPLYTFSLSSFPDFNVFHFGSKDFKASLSNTEIVQTADSLIYVANLSGVLEYDGSEWRKLDLPNYSSAFALFYDDQDDLLYVGGTNEFGFFKKDNSGLRQYYSLRHFTELDERIPDVNQIIRVKDKIYFNTSEQLLIWDGHNIKIIPFAMSRLLKLGDRVFVSVLKKGIAKIENDTLVFVNKELGWKLEYPFGKIHLEGDVYLVGSYSNGLFTFNTKSFESSPWETSANEFSNKNYMADFKVWRDSLLLIATYEGGLLISDKKGKPITIIDEDAGLNSNYLGRVFVDIKGNIWIAGYYGIEVIRLNENEGISPLSIPKIRFISVNQKQVPAYQTTIINASPSDVSFHFSMPGSVLNDIEFSYYLEGVDKNWSAWSKKPVKEYREINSGNYIFRVRARSQSGITSKEAKTFISIPTPWHENPSTYIISTLIIALLFLLTNFLINRRLKNQNKRLEAIVDERTSELLQTNKELKITNTELDNFVYRSSHDLVAPLKSLKGLINIAQIDPNQRSTSEYLEKMSSRVNKLEDFIKSIMEYSINSKRHTIIERVKLDDIIESVAEDIKYYRNAEKVELIKDFDPDTVISTDKKRLEIILSNLVTNCIKYHDYHKVSPHIRVTAAIENNKYTIQIIDNGLGIREEYLKNIFNMFFRASNNSEGSGLGLYIVRDMVDKLGGTVEVQSKVGEGTSFAIKLPIN